MCSQNRMEGSFAVITTAEGADRAYYERKVAAVRDALPAGSSLLPVTAGAEVDIPREELRSMLTLREVLAEAAVKAVEAVSADALIFLPDAEACVPALLMAALRLNRPAIVINGFEAQESGVAALPASLGLALKGGDIPSSVEALIAAAKNNLRPCDIVTDAALRNAAACDMASGGSTDNVLHLLALSADSKLSLKLENIDEISRTTPLLCAPEQASVAAVMKNLLAAGLVDGEVLTVSGHSLKEELNGLSAEKRVHPVEDPLSAEGGLVILRGTIAPRGAVVKQSGLAPALRYFEGPARVFNSEAEAVEGVRQGKVQAGEVLIICYEGPRCGSGMPLMTEIGPALVAAGLDQSVALLSDGRFGSNVRGLAVGHVSLEAREGSTISVLDNGDRIRIDLDSRALDVIIDPEELGVRRLMRDPRPVSSKSEFMQQYAAWVRPASEGALYKRDFNTL